MVTGLLLWMHVCLAEFLGDITLLPKEVLSIPVHSIFTGAFFDYDLSTDTAEHVSVVQTGRVTLSRVVPLKSRQKGPVWMYKKSTYFVLYSEEILEVWSMEKGSPTPVWELRVSGIQGVDIVHTEFSDLLYWTNTNQFFSVRWELQVEVLTPRLIPNIRVYNNTKVAVCTNDRQMITAGGEQHSNVLTRYSLKVDSSGISISDTQSKYWTEEIIDIVCTNNYYVLTSGALYNSGFYDQRNAAGFHSLRKINDNAFSISSKTLSLLISQRTSMLLNSNALGVDITALKVIKDAIYGVTVYKGTLSLISMRSALPEWQVMQIPAECARKCDFVWLPSEYSDFPFLLTLTETEMRVFALRLGSYALQVKARIQSFSFTLCATEYYYGQIQCVNSTVLTLPDSETAILAKNGFNLIAPISPISLTCLILGKVSKCEFQPNDFFSGSNLIHSIEMPETPEYLNIHQIEEQQLFHKTICSYPLIPPSFARCLSYSEISCLVIYIANSRVFVNSESIDTHSLTTKLNVIACTLVGSTMILYGDIGNDFYFEVIKLSPIEIALINAPAGIRYFQLTESHLVVYSGYQVYLLDLESPKLQLLKEFTQPIIDLSVCEADLWISLPDELQYLNLLTLKSETLIQTGILQILCLENQLITYQSSAEIVWYRILETALLERNRVSLDQKCKFASFHQVETWLAVNCTSYLQIMSPSSQLHSAKIMTLEIPKDAFFQQHLLFFPDCKARGCLLFRASFGGYLSDRKIISIEIRNSDKFSLADSAFITGNISISSNSEEVVSVPLILTLENSGNFIRSKSKAETYIAVPWTDSYRLDLWDVFEGQNMLFSLQASLEVEYYLRNTVSVAQRLNFSNYHNFDIQTDSQLIVIAEPSYLNIQRYTCLGELCEVVAIHKLPVASLLVAEIQSVYILAVGDDSILLRLVGFQDFEYLAQFAVFITYNFGSQEIALLFKLATIQSPFRVISESRALIHIFECRNPLFHYIVSWDGQFRLSGHEVVSPYLVSVIALSSVDVDGAWKLYVCTKFTGLYEFQLSSKLQCGKVTNLHIEVSKIEYISPDMIIFYSNLGSTTYSLPSLTHQSSPLWTDCTGPSTRPPIEYIASELLYLRCGPRLIVNPHNSRASQMIAILNETLLKFTGKLEAVAYDLQHQQLVFFQFNSPELIFPSLRKTLAETVNFTISARNQYGEARSQLFIVTRFNSDGNVIVIILICVFVTLLGMLLLWKKLRRPNLTYEVELTTVRSEDSHP